ncbi:hypothetical protein [Parasedimentitalea maritima]|uniref:DUF4259 domain-containing protein n=1 Tax=Parasedimentitalea maritima TaxID=2578117 RepID=A0A6A4RIL3_9RHOB|nr:hypothetical protein [Zongyanglinia marina]KAE9630183.1 hypothetical protein GP644_10945 [Zongyanglinia marina]
MGTWGYKVGEDDAFCDVYNFYFDIYNQGASPEEASERVLDEMSDNFSDFEDRYEAFLALAFAQWETQHKDIRVLEETERFITTGESLEIWSERGGDETLIKRRRSALHSFLRKLSKPRRSKKRRAHKVPEFKETILVDLLAPDNRKALKIQENYLDGKFLHTSATVMWGEGGGSIFHSDRSGLMIIGEWLGPQNLRVCFLNAIRDDLIFGMGNPNEAFFCGDSVTLAYEFSD